MIFHRLPRFVRFLASTLVATAVFSTAAMAQEDAAAPPPDELEGDFGAPFDPSDDSTSPDPSVKDSKPPEPNKTDEPESTGGDWGPEGETAPVVAPQTAPKPRVRRPTPGALDPYASEEKAPPPESEAEPVEGLDDVTTFAALGGAAAVMNLGIGGAITGASIVATLVDPPTLRNPFAPLPLAVGLLNCGWSCLVAPAATGFLVAFLGDLASKKRGTLLIPIATAFGTALLVGLPVSLAATLGGLAVAAQARPGDVVAVNIAVNAISIAGAAVVGLAVSGATAGAYLLFAEDRRPGDPGGGMPGFTQPAHQAPGLRVAAPGTLKRRTASMAY